MARELVMSVTVRSRARIASAMVRQVVEESSITMSFSWMMETAAAAMRSFVCWR